MVISMRINSFISNFNNMKKFISKTILFASPILIFLITVNYFGDAARLFDNDYEIKMADIISNNKYVTNIVNFDERLLQKELISNKSILPDIVVIGSSRSMLINSDYFPDVSFFNNSVSGASIEDIASIYQLYKDYHKLPKKIIIGIDPWTFNDNNGQKRWQSISYYFYRFQNIINRDNFKTFKYKELFSLSYFQSSIKFLPRLIHQNIDPQPTTVKYNITATRLTDGSLVYEKSYREVSENGIKNRIKSYLTDKIYSIENFNTISSKIWIVFDKLIDDMRENNIEIELFLAPYAPLVYRKIEAKYPMVLKTEEVIRDFAKINKIKLYGSFNPFKLGMDESYFYDGMHCKETGINIIMK